MSDLFYTFSKRAYLTKIITHSHLETWCWLDGLLIAPKSFYELGNVALRTRIVLGRFSGVTIEGAFDYPYPKKIPSQKSQAKIVPDIYSLFIKNNSPSSILFDEAGFENSPTSLGIVNHIAAGFVEKGYGGYLNLFSGYKNNDPFDNPETMKLLLGTSLVLKLTWNESLGGKKTNFDFIFHHLPSLEYSLTNEVELKRKGIYL